MPNPASGVRRTSTPPARKAAVYRAGAHTSTPASTRPAALVSRCAWVAITPASRAMPSGVSGNTRS